jgi:transitional endoplasmic reticulum ATPase
MLALRDNLEADEIPYKYFKKAIDKVKPGNTQIQEEQLVQYM